METTYIQDDMFKTSTKDDVVIFNFKTNKISLLNPGNKLYWSGTLSEFKKDVVDGMRIKMEAAMEQVPEEHRDMYSKMYEDIINKIESGEGNSWPDMEIKKTSETSNITGYSADKYQIWQHGTLREDIWIAESLDIRSEIDFNKFKEFFKSFTNVASDRSVENSPQFLELVEKGYPIKTVEYQENFKTTTTAVKVEKKSIPATEFNIPSDYQKVNIMDLWGE
jgi:hypothetical protein